MFGGDRGEHFQDVGRFLQDLAAVGGDELGNLFLELLSEGGVIVHDAEGRDEGCATRGADDVGNSVPHEFAHDVRPLDIMRWCSSTPRS